MLPSWLSDSFLVAFFALQRAKKAAQEVERKQRRLPTKSREGKEGLLCFLLTSLAAFFCLLCFLLMSWAAFFAFFYLLGQPSVPSLTFLCSLLCFLLPSWAAFCAFSYLLGQSSLPSLTFLGCLLCFLPKKLWSIYLPIITGRQYWRLRRDAQKKKIWKKLCN